MAKDGEIREREPAPDTRVDLDELKGKAQKVYTELGRYIYELRATRGYNQRQLAELSGVQQSYICRIEHGEGNPTWDSLNKISHAFGLTFPQFMMAALTRHTNPDPAIQRVMSSIVSMLQPEGDTGSPTASQSGVIIDQTD